MNKKTTNTYERNAKRKSMLGAVTQDLPTKGDAKNSAIETVKDVVVGVIGGGVAGAALGRASLLVGAAVTGIGHYTKSRLASIFGLGMMASGTYQQIPSENVNGTESDTVEAAKQRVLAFKEGMKHKLFLDKLMKSKKDAAGTEQVNGTPNVKYFVYPSGELQGAEDHIAALDRLEQSVARSAEQFAAGEPEVSRLLQGHQDDDIDPLEQNF